MLTIYVYKNIPFQNDMKNVLYLENDTAKMQYLNQFLEGTKTNIQKFFNNDNYIDLDLLYEDCNYMVIYDDRSTRPYKYFFIERNEFVSSAVRYHLILDIWQTYGNSIEMLNSHMCAGHYDAIMRTPFERVDRYLKYEPSGQKIMSVSKPLLDTWDNVKNCTIIVVGKTEDGTKLFMCNCTNDAQLLHAIMEMQENKYALRGTGSITWHAYETLKVYVINDINIIDKLNHEFITYDPFFDMFLGIPDVPSDIYPSWRYFSGDAGQVVGSETIFNSNVFKIELKSILAFDNSSYYDMTEKLKRKYLIGTISNNQELSNISALYSPQIKINYYQFRNNQIAIYLEYEATKINITNEFEIPFINDNYTLYMAQNQATIDTNNKQNAIQLASILGTSALSLGLAGFTGGASLMLGASALTQSIGVGVKQMQQNASIESAKHSIDRLDGIYSAGLLTLKNGVNIWSIIYDNEDIDAFVNNYGTIQAYYTNDFLAIDKTLYNFNYIQFDNVNINGDFTNEIKLKFENMFLNGVRIWYDTTYFLQTFF